jgi:beta-lactamase regulating signal transducer with metallopeptidase domain
VLDLTLLTAVCCLQHDFKSADDTVSNSLLPSVASLCTELDHHLDAAEEVMQCCRVGSTSFVTQTLLLIWACAGGAAVFFVLVGVALCARFAKQKAVKSLGLPTYGLPMYSGKSGTWSF